MFGIGPTYYPNLPLTISTKDTVLRDLKEFASLWDIFLNHFDDHLIESWKPQGPGIYSLKLKELLRLWVPSRNVDGKIFPEGGTILILEKEIEMKLSQQELLFCKGFSLFCDTPFGVKEVKVVKMAIVDNDHIEMEAGFKVPIFGFKSDSKRKPKNLYIKEWSEGVPLSSHDSNKVILLEKIKQLH